MHLWLTKASVRDDSDTIAAPAQARCPIDIEIGSRLRSKRIARGMTKAKLTGAVGMPLSLLSNYEDGSNRIASGHLAAIAAILGASIPYFFEKSSNDFSPGRTEAAPP